MAQGGGAPPPEAMRASGGRRFVAVAALVAAIIAFLAGIGVGYLVYAPTPPKTTLFVGTNLPFPPFESYNDTTGSFIGFDMDLARLIGNATGRHVEFRNFNDFGLLLTTVSQGGVDLAASGITMSGAKGAQRNATMSFSDPYYNANQAVIVKASDTTTCPNNVCTAQQIGNHTIGVQSSTTSEGWVDTYITPFDPNNHTDIHRYSSVTTELQDLKSGVYQFMIIDAGPATAIVGGSSGVLRLVGTIITNELYGLAVKKGDPEGLIPVINNVLAQLKASGDYTKLINKWFGP